MLTLTYVSSATAPMDEPTLVRLLGEIGPRNRGRDLTGMLLYRGGNIISTLEGPERAVEETFATITRDPRHHGILVLLREQTQHRQFSDWSTSFPRPTVEPDPRLTGYTPFLTCGRDRADAAPGRRLLEVFRASMR
ncbi:BLUF domain-containing protein [Nocardioides ferulae]|uniref:BLUF domain-containing protein n=1 Tax=Nocardioides ferulae TaxID=2340821 RepID=UPI000EB29D96|nr:BLUF domain-containing protein [Nocardioides ferulae]